MAVTITKVADGEWSIGNKIGVIVDLSAITYVSSGVPIAAGDVGLGKILGAQILGGSATAALLNWFWDSTNLKLMAFFPTGGASTPGTLIAPVLTASSVTGNCTAGGQTASSVDVTTPTITGTAVAQALVAGVSKESGAIALTNCTVRVMFIGY